MPSVRARVTRWTLGGGVLLVAIGVYAGLTAAVIGLSRPRAPALPDGPALIERIREVARLEALDVELRKQVSWAPDPVASGSLVVDVLHWAKDLVRPVEGTMWVAGTAHVGVDLARLDVARIHVVDRVAWIDLPPLVTDVALDPAGTHALRGNLDQEGTARLLAKARLHLVFEVERDVAVQAKARVAVEKALRGLLLPLGFAAVEFAPPPTRSGRPHPPAEA